MHLAPLTEIWGIRHSRYRNWI